MNMNRIFENINEYYSPKIVAEVNDSYVKVAKFKGEFLEHSHEQSDEMFLVLKGSIDLICNGKSNKLNEMDSFVVKKGEFHKPFAKDEAWVLMVEYKDTLHTGNLMTELTKSIEEQK
ncbi:MAG: cupin domain-containing protein [Mycoplasmatales bacterium]|nr:cupin domain-containing protein [Mycoplasmatales bacterium]